MPRYEYKHLNEPCEKGGKVFEVIQSIHDEPLTKCPYCSGKVKRIISRVNISVPTSDTRLKEKGFAKLVRRDKGVYENVTALKHEKKIFEANKPETMPDLKKRIPD